VVGHLTIGEFFYNQELADRGQELEAVAQAITAGAARPSAESIWTYVRKDGTRRRGAISVTPRTSVGHPVGYVVVAIDVTEREQLAVERERLLAVQREVTEVLVEQNNRLRELTQMKDDVVATVSHELRTPLTSIRGFIELLLDDHNNTLDGEQVRMLTTIERNSLHLLNVADDLLADPGGGHGLRVHFVDADLAVIASEAVDTMAAQASTQRVQLNLDTEGPVIVHGDPARLHQLLGNLISNAVKFSSRGGRVLVLVDTWDQFARLQVLDDGPGIPDEERPQLFERFYRLASATDQGIPGTGLGLAIAKSVVEAHDGTVDIIDTPGWSTTFRVLLPLSDSKVQHAPAVSA
jgi:signal transduction histidine kinase